MSLQAIAPAPEPQSPPVPQPKEIPEVTDAYRKAHKAYVLTSGLLASWELIGITLDTKEKWGIELKSPKAVPLILFTLVFYSGYKMTVEWVQCDGERRKNRAARLDYWVAHSIAFAALAISVIQYLARVQIVDFLSRYGDQIFAGVLAFIVMFLSAQVITWRPRRKQLVWRVWLLFTIMLGAAFLCLMLMFVGHHVYVATASGAAVGIILGIAYVRLRLEKRRMDEVITQLTNKSPVEGN